MGSSFGQEVRFVHKISPEMTDPTYAFKVIALLVSKWQYVKDGLHNDRGEDRGWRSCLRHWATTRKVAGSITGDVTVLFH